MLDSRRLLYFMRIVEFGSLSRAAKSLGVAQPALSHHIRLLEEHLGVILLVRRSRGVSVTDAGETLLEHARAVVERIEEAERELRSSNREPSGTVRLGLASSIAAPLTPILLSSLRQRHPNVILHIVEGTSTALAEWVRTERLDLAINLDGVPEHPTTPLFNEYLYLVGSADKQLSPDIAIDFDDVVKLPLMLPTRQHSMRMLIERATVARSQSIRPVFEIDGFEPLKAAVVAGLGYSILSWPAIQKEYVQGTLSVAKIVNPSIQRTLVLDAPRQARLSQTATAVRRLVCDTVVDLLQSGTWRGDLCFEAEND